jgi:hypothetical protein
VNFIPKLNVYIQILVGTECIYSYIYFLYFSFSYFPNLGLKFKFILVVKFILYVSLPKFRYPYELNLFNFYIYFILFV